MAGTSDIIAYGFGSWSTVAKVPTLGFGIAVVAWTDPTNCAITTDVTMTANSLTDDVTLTANSLTDDVTLTANSLTDDVGMGCGNQ